MDCRLIVTIVAAIVLIFLISTFLIELRAHRNEIVLSLIELSCLERGTDPQSIYIHSIRRIDKHSDFLECLRSFGSWHIPVEGAYKVRMSFLDGPFAGYTFTFIFYIEQCPSGGAFIADVVPDTR